MENFINYLSTHQGAITISVIVALFIIYFLFTKLIKMAFIFTLILLAIGGFLYVKDPKKISESVKQTVEEVKTHPGKILDTSKNAYRDAKDLFERGKKLPGEIDKLMSTQEKSKGE